MAKKKEEKEEVEVVVDAEKVTEQLMNKFRKSFKVKSASTYHDDSSFISTGSIGLDMILIRPLPVGIHELAGHFGSGKTTLALQIIANAQKKGHPCFYVNIERGLTTSLMKCIKGLDKEKLTILEPNDGEDATQAIIDIFQTVDKAVVVLDSVASCSATKAVVAKTMENKTMGTLGALMSLFLAKVNPIVDNSKGRLILINQIRESIGEEWKKFTPGGKAGEHYTTQRIFFKASDYKSNNIPKDATTDAVGKYIEFELYKNRYSRPGLKRRVPLKFGEGIWRALEVFELGVELGIINHEGNTFSYKGEKIAVGEQKAKDAILNNPELMVTITKELYDTMGISEN